MFCNSLGCVENNLFGTLTGACFDDPKWLGNLRRTCTACIRISLSLTRTTVSIILIAHGIPMNSPKPFIGCGYAPESIWTKTVAKKPPEWVYANVVVPK